MRLKNAAWGLAAVGAGLLVASLLRRRDEFGNVIDVESSPPEPNELIGYPASHKSAAESADVLRRGVSGQRPM